MYVCIGALTAWLTCKSACHYMRNLDDGPGHLLLFLLVILLFLKYKQIITVEYQYKFEIIGM